MVALNLNIRDEAYDKIIYLLESLPKQDIQIVDKRIIEEIDPLILKKDDFDYISPKEMIEINRLSQMINSGNFSEFTDFEDLKNEL